MHRAADYGNTGAATQALLAAGSNTDARDEAGNTPLHTAAAYAEDSFWDQDLRHAGAAIGALLAAGANAGARNAAGQTPWDLAQANETLKGSDAYRRLNDAHFKAPGA